MPPMIAEDDDLEAGRRQRRGSSSSSSSSWWESALNPPHPHLCLPQTKEEEEDIVEEDFPSKKSPSGGMDDSFLIEMPKKHFEDFERKVLDHIHIVPFLVMTVIMVRMCLVHAINHQFETDDNSFDYFFYILGITSLLVLWGHFLWKLWYCNESTSVQSKISVDNMVMLLLCLGFSVLLVVMSLHECSLSSAVTSNNHNNKNSKDGDFHNRRFFSGEEGYAVHYELMVYILALPVMCQIAFSHVSLTCITWSWFISFFAVMVSIITLSNEKHALVSIPIVVALVLKSLLLMLYVRRQRTSLMKIYLQFADMQNLHKNLVMQVDKKKEEILEQRHMMANTAHDLKTVSNFIFDSLKRI